MSGKAVYLVVYPGVEGPVLEALVGPGVPQGEGVGDGAPQELGRDVRLRVHLILNLKWNIFLCAAEIFLWETSNISLPVYLRVLGWLSPVLAVGGEVAGVVVVRVLDLGRVGEGDHHQVVVADGPVLLAGLHTEGVSKILQAA